MLGSVRAINGRPAAAASRFGSPNPSCSEVRSTTSLAASNASTAGLPVSPPSNTLKRRRQP